MNREIKFRAWRNGSMTYNHSFTLGIDGHLSLLDESGQWRPAQYGEVALMQYTGLKDNNGKEIYEGDILKEPSNTSYKFKGTGEVVYESDYGGFAVVGEWHRNQHHELLTCDVACDCVVIGNKFQNSDLLK